MRIHQQPAFLLHARPWSETSLLVDMFTREYGRFRLLAKGARRQKTGQRAILQPFQPLSISWSGKRSLMTLTGTEARQTYPRLRAGNLASAYYMSELLFKFLHANDAHEVLFEAYATAIEKLSSAQDAEAILRGFECSLLSEVGYGLQLEHDAVSLLPVKASACYFYYPEKGPVEILQTRDAAGRDSMGQFGNGQREYDEYEHARNTSEQYGDGQYVDGQYESGLAVSGNTLIALARRKYESDQTRKESKRLLRTLLTRQLNGRPFNTREVYAQMLKTR